MMLKVRSHDPDLQRKGRVLAIMLLGMEAAAFVLAFLNIMNGDTHYNLANAIFISLILGLYILNRFGFVRIASLLTVLLTTAGPFTIGESLTAMYMTMTIPILIASSLLVSWGGFVVVALLIISAVVFGVASLPRSAE